MNFDHLAKARELIEKYAFKKAVIDTCLIISQNVKDYSFEDLQNSLHVYEEGDKTYLGSKISASFHLLYHIRRSSKIESGMQLLEKLQTEVEIRALSEKLSAALSDMDEFKEFTYDIPSTILEDSFLVEGLDEFGSFISLLIASAKYNSPILELLDEDVKLVRKYQFASKFVVKFIAVTFLSPLLLVTVSKPIYHIADFDLLEWLGLHNSILSFVLHANWLTFVIGLLVYVALVYAVTNIAINLSAGITKRSTKKIDRRDLISYYIGRSGNGDGHVEVLSSMYLLIATDLSGLFREDYLIAFYKYLFSPDWDEIKAVRFLKRGIGRKYRNILTEKLENIKRDHVSVGLKSPIEF